MTSAEFRCTREYLGLPLNWVAKRLDVTERTVYRWEAGVTPIPPHAVDMLRGMAKYTDRAAKSLYTHGKLTTYTDAVTIGDEELPASWHRILCARVAARTGVQITYDDNAPAPLPAVTQ